MKASVALVLASFLLPHLVAEDDEEDVRVASNRIKLEAGYDEVSRKSNTNNHKAIEEQQAFEGGRGGGSSSEDATTTTGENHQNDQAFSAPVEASGGLASQKILEDESLTQLPSQLKYYYHHYENSNGPFVWAPEFVLLPQSTSNHVVVPPYRPFVAAAPADETQLALGRMAAAAKRKAQQEQWRQQQQQQQQRRRRAPNQTVDQTDPPRAFGTTPSPDFVNNLDDAESAAPPLIQTQTNLTISNATQGGEEAPRVTNETLVGEEGEPTVETEELPQQQEKVVVDYAGKSAGALVIEKSSGWKGTSNLLRDDNDQYAMVPTQQENKSLIIALSEEILVKQVVLSNYERYSSNVKDFQILGSQTMAHWADLGSYTATPGRFGKQEFETEDSAHWARYLKFKFLSHYGDEHYLTITQISVHGTTMQQGFHEHWDEQQEAGDEAVEDGTEATVTNSTSLLHNALTQQHVGLSLTDNGSNEPVCTPFGRLGIDGNDPSPMDAPKCRRTMLFSASVSAHSTAVRSALHDRLLSESENKTQRETALVWQSAVSPLHTQVRKQKKSDMIVQGQAFLAPLVLEKSRVVGDLLSMMEEMTGQQFGEIKSTLVQTHRGDFKPTLEEEAGVENQTQVLEPGSQSGQNSSSGGGGGEKEDHREAAVASDEAVPSKEQGPLNDALVIEDSLTMAFLLDKVPSAACLQELNFSQYKNKSAPTRTSSNGGPTNNSPSAGGMEPIFKKLTDEIRGLQTALSVHEKFSKDAISCFQRVLLDLVLHHAMEQDKQNRRLEYVEHILSGRFFYHALLEMASTTGRVLDNVWLLEDFWSQVSLVEWTYVYSWILENRAWAVGFPLLFLCILLFRRQRHKKH